MKNKPAMKVSGNCSLIELIRATSKSQLITSMSNFILQAINKSFNTAQ